MDFDEFFRSERDALIRLCWLLTLDRDAAADVAQEAMTRAWSSWDQLSSEGSNPAAWVRVVATNLARSRWRRLSRAARLDPTARPEPQRYPVSDPELLGALDSLAPRQREAIVLRYWADLKLEDCADAMGVSVGSVKRHLVRARGRLGELIDSSAIEELTL